MPLRPLCGLSESKSEGDWGGLFLAAKSSKDSKNITKKSEFKISKKKPWCVFFLEKLHSGVNIPMFSRVSVDPGVPLIRRPYRSEVAVFLRGAKSTTTREAECGVGGRSEPPYQ